MASNNYPQAPIITISQVAPSIESLHLSHKPEAEEEIPLCDLNHLPDLHIDRTFQRRESILASQISLFVEKTKQKIPDGGWGWWVVLACFIINMISDGVSFTFGLLYIEFLHEFGASKSATAWIGSLFMALPLIAGPIGSALVDRYGCRSMTIIGGLVCTIGLTLSSYAKSIGVMYLTFGVIGGLGMCLCFVTAVVSIAFWFEKRRTIALGLAASGTGFGTALFSPLATWLLSEFGWRGTLLIIAGIFAHMCVCGALMRDPDWIIEEEEREKKLKKRRDSSSSSSGTSVHMEELKNALKRGDDAHYLLENVDTSLDLSDKDRFSSAINLPTYIKDNEKVPLEVLKQLSENKRIYNIILENYPHLLSCRSSSDQALNTPPEENTITSPRIPMRFSLKLKKTEEPIDPTNAPESPTTPTAIIIKSPLTPQPVKRKMPPFIRSISHAAKTQMQPHTYLRNVRFRKSSISYRGAMLNIHKYKMKASSCPDLFKNSMASLRDEELHFLLLSLSTIILFIWFIVPYFYLADHMDRSGYSESQASFVISVIGVTNTVGMVLLGLAGERLNVAKTYSICLILCGVSIGAILFFTDYYVLLVISSGFFGLFFASCLSLTPSLLAELVTLEEFTMAYGLVLLCQGIGNLTGPPLAGFLFDLTHSWHQSFYQASFWIIVSGLLIGIIPFTTNRKLGGPKPIRKLDTIEEEKDILP